MSAYLDRPLRSQTEYAAELELRLELLEITRLDLATFFASGLAPRQTMALDREAGEIKRKIALLREPRAAS